MYKIHNTLTIALDVEIGDNDLASPQAAAADGQTLLAKF
jgi:hypothetical protein